MNDISSLLRKFVHEAMNEAPKKGRRFLTGRTGHRVPVPAGWGTAGGVTPYKGASAMPWLREFTEQAIEMMAEGELKFETFRDALHANGLTTSNQAGVIASVCVQIANSISVHGRGGGSQSHERQHLENALLRWKRGRETNDVELVIGRNEDGTVKHEPHEVWVAPDCTVTTHDHKPIWTFDTETLAIGHVATLHDCKVGKEHCATLETIESGEV